MEDSERKALIIDPVNSSGNIDHGQNLVLNYGAIAHMGPLSKICGRVRQRKMGHTLSHRLNPPDIGNESQNFLGSSGTIAELPVEQPRPFADSVT